MKRNDKVIVLTTAAAKFPPQDVVPVSANPAYEQVTLKSVAVQENSVHTVVHTVSPAAAVVAHITKNIDNSTEIITKI